MHILPECGCYKSRAFMTQFTVYTTAKCCWGKDKLCVTHSICLILQSPVMHAHDDIFPRSLLEEQMQQEQTTSTFTPGVAHHCTQHPTRVIPRCGSPFLPPTIFTPG